MAVKPVSPPVPAPVPILGQPLHLLSFAQAEATARAWVAARRRTYLCHVDARSLLAARDDPAVAAALAGAGLALTDGMPLVWLARRRHPRAERVYGPDLMRALLAGPPLRHAFFGTTPDTLARLARAVADRYPRAVVAGALAPPMGGWDAAEDARLCAALDAMAADVVWVGLGAPRQEVWMAANRVRLEAPLLVGVGAAFDYLAGVKPQAPRWMRRAGLEWLFRLLSEPRRLGGRTLRTVPRFAWLAAGEVIRTVRSR